jgi:DNA-binding CsgD family transcriptional regulator
LIGAEHGVLWQNDSVRRLTGRMAQTLGDLAPGDEQRVLLEQEARGLTHGDGPTTLVLRGQYAGDRSATIRVRLVRCPPPDSALLVTLADITDYEALSRQLSDRERSQSFLKSATSDLLLRMDPEGRIAWRNDAAAQLFPEGVSLVESLDGPTAMALEDWIRPWKEGLSGGEGLDAKRECVLNSAPGLEPRWHLRGVGRILTDEAGVFQGISLILHDESDTGRVQQFARSLSLSPREEEILQYLVTGYSNLNMAMILGLSESGVKFHVKNIMGKARVSSRTELLAQLFRL